MRRRKPGFKLKLPLIGFWVVTDRRLRAGYRQRYEQGYLEGAAAARTPAPRPELAANEMFTGRVQRSADAELSCGERDAIADAASA